MVRTLLSLICLLFILFSCSEQQPPDPTSEEYRQAVSSFYLSLAAIESDQAVFATEKMNEVAEAFPREPAAWANLGVFSMRRGNFEMASDQLSQAEDLAPKNADIQFLYGILESRRGNIQASIDHLQKAVERDPDNPQVIYALISELERQDVQLNAEQIRSLLDRLKQLQPENLAVKLETTRLASKMNDAELLESSLQTLSAQSEGWPAEVQREFENLREEILGKPVEELTFEIAYLRNNLNKLSGFEADFDRIELPPNQVGFLLTDFMWLPEPATSNEAPDKGIAFDAESLQQAADNVDYAFHLSLAEDSIPDLITITGNRARLDGGPSFELPSGTGEPLSPLQVETFDYNYDFLNDIAFAGSRGLTVYRQEEGRSFEEVTPELGLAPSILNDTYSAVWSADFDLDGDLDLVLGRNAQSPRILRNNGDGTFTVDEIFPEVDNPVAFAWADLDADG
ncbi:MAG: FG-GAP-like repeat-containing protein, partial [Balneolaceae bacterium]|nr:FG-GAP-like repeat-containing protein [Balneolaceae bacterium]